MLAAGRAAVEDFAAVDRALAERDAPDDPAEAERLVDVDVLALELALVFAFGFGFDLDFDFDFDFEGAFALRFFADAAPRPLPAAERVFPLDLERDAIFLAPPEPFFFPFPAVLPAAFVFFLATPFLLSRAFAGARIIQFR